jgi:hypothetical protein
MAKNKKELDYSDVLAFQFAFNHDYNAVVVSAADKKVIEELEVFEDFKKDRKLSKSAILVTFEEVQTGKVKEIVAESKKSKEVKPK